MIPVQSLDHLRKKQPQTTNYVVNNCRRNFRNRDRVLTLSLRRSNRKVIPPKINGNKFIKEKQLLEDISDISTEILQRKHICFKPYSKK